MAEDTNIDDDLQDLLNQLDDQESVEVVEEEKEELELEAVDEAEPEEPEAEVEVEQKPGTQVPTTGDEIPPLRPIDEMIPTDVRMFDELPGSSSAAAAEIVQDEQSTVNLQKYLEQMDGVTKEVLQACQSDRQEAQDVINMLRREIDTAHNAQKTPQRMYVDGLVKSVEVKAGINATAVKMMEGVGKMIAATKAGVNIQQNSVHVASEELDELLSQNIPDDLD